MSDLFNAIIKPNDLVFDVGANHGAKTLLFLGHGARVVCFEPQPQCLVELRRMLAHNPRVRIEPIGLGETKKETLIYLGQADTLSTMSPEFIRATSRQRFHGHRWGEPYPVSIDTLDAMIARHGLPAFAKIDVEGYEYNVLCGLSRPIPCLSVEFTPELKEQTLQCMDRLLTIDSGYRFNYSEGESGRFHFPEFVSLPEMWGFLKQNNDFALSFGDVYAQC